MTRNAALLLAALLITAGVACDDNSTPTAPIVEQPDIETTIDTFEGSIALGETSCHVISSTQAGPAELQITSLQPLATLTVGLGIGLDDDDPDSACPFFATDSSVRVGDTLLTTLTSVAAYCVCIFDVGNIFPDQTVDYVFQVDHP